MQLKKAELAREIDEAIKRIDAKLASGSPGPELEDALQAERAELERRRSRSPSEDSTSSV
jgi:hypothetical protein